ncbi:RimK family alpha-L-glutamate ligase [Elizabethkingia anophelis]|uniref:ATP-grasp domain-containing protein n=1 Tax=Elizabethkingia anophelis TaxID=1117645 RepID=UPI000530FE56|nr:hypothetical protein [Elizabethkingia anophelis]KGT10124.1 hypothetical protein NV63_01990 [Elizabethkingia anophelis]MCT3698165.1 hypothetical protein [Elizabethkingia anophelis]MCT3760127.1 hypothetical protein [Elizabethkingia anophelis]MCT3832476.1 hypothetical protein [Elizabethkingia anophelis]MCT3974841.1 hypothetical protein [Elizabethkingia anophelis]
MKLAFVGNKLQEKFSTGTTNDEDTDLLNFLKEKGFDINLVIWNDNNINWTDYDVVIIKSPWDYHEHVIEFSNWLDSLHKLHIKVLNPVDTIKWNSNKHYLKDISNQGLPVIRTEYLSKGNEFHDEFFEMFGKDTLVVKPCVSAGARNTITVSKETVSDKRAEINTLISEEDYMVQPFVNEIKEGEWSFLFFNGKYSHCALKKPKQGDFRVQHYHGGSISYPEADPKHIAQAEEYLKVVPQQTLYARVDGVLVDNTFQLMELELIEPYLFLNSDTTLFENYYQALLQHIQFDK